MLTTPWRISRYAVGVYRPNLRQLARWQSSGSSVNAPVPQALLGRARSLAAEHAQLSSQLDNQYETEVAKKVGSLSEIAEYWKSLEKAYNVRNSP